MIPKPTNSKPLSPPFRDSGSGHICHLSTLFCRHRITSPLAPPASKPFPCAKLSHLYKSDHEVMEYQAAFYNGSAFPATMASSLLILVLFSLRSRSCVGAGHTTGNERTSLPGAYSCIFIAKHPHSCKTKAKTCRWILCICSEDLATCWKATEQRKYLSSSFNVLLFLSLCLLHGLCKIIKRWKSHPIKRSQI